MNYGYEQDEEWPVPQATTADSQVEEGAAPYEHQKAISWLRAHMHTVVCLEPVQETVVEHYN